MLLESKNLMINNCYPRANILFYRNIVLAGALLLGLNACVGIPDGVEPVTGVELEKYLGTWYEIARLDHSFERGLSNVTATYSKREDGGIRVINRGYNAQEGEWDEAEGKAYFVGQSDVGRLKVSFFGPFYGGYNIIELDMQNYQYSLVAGPDRSYLWILARQPQLDEAILQRLVAKANSLGFATDKLIYVSHNQEVVDKPANP
jgi:apolipoprotein D and lipocalin family protein